jgi:hypothetical protein
MLSVTERVDHVTEMGLLASVLPPGPDVVITSRKTFSGQFKEWRRRSVS